jgi:hypothetical protein
MVGAIKTLTTENWLQPDPTSTIFVRVSHADGSVSPMSGEDWVAQFLTPSLNDNVPKELRRLFEVARAALAYGYFFYPLYTLAGEQLYRVAEAAVSEKCAMLGAPKKKSSFQDKIKYLVDKNVIPNEEFIRWDAFRQLRNMSSHPRRQNILAPGMVATTLHLVAERINDLFQ